MENEIVVIPVPENTATEAIAEEIAEAVAAKLDEDEDETQWVRDLFLSAIEPLRNEMNNLTLQISALLTRVPDQESYNRLQETLANLLQTKLLTEPLIPNPTPEAIVIQADPIPEAIPEAIPEPVSAEDAEKAPKTEPHKKHRRL